MVVLFKLVRYMLIFLYDVLNNRRMVYVRIVLPRGDDKLSREHARDVAKDMKEKISRMGQVYDALHKLGESSFYESALRWVFRKPKVSLIWHYENGLLYCIMGVYPEYRKIVESSVAAQFPDASIELLEKRPRFFSKKYYDITVMEEEKHQVFPIKTFKQMPDDPINNIVDTMGKMSSEDTFTMVMPIKPVGDRFNRKAQKWATGLYRRDKFYMRKGKTSWKWFFPPYWIIAFIGFLMRSGSTKKEEKMDRETIQAGGKDLVRMTKAEEEALNVMGEEAGKHAFDTGIILISSSDSKERTSQNIDNMISIFTIYRDEFNNELDNNEFLSDALGFFFKPLWRFAARFSLPHFFFKKSIMTPNALTSLFHLPDGMYNHAPIIKWLDYKMLAPPDNLPHLQEPTDYIITGKVAEDYLDGQVSRILEKASHWAVGEKEETKTEYLPYTQ